MRVNGIKIHLEIPIPINSDGSSEHYRMPCFKDCNGITYEINAIKGACDKATSLPIIIYDEQNKSIPIGIADAVKWDSDKCCIIIDGILNYGGTCEKTIFSSAKDIVDMTIESIGFGT